MRSLDRPVCSSTGPTGAKKQKQEDDEQRQLRSSALDSLVLLGLDSLDHVVQVSGSSGGSISCQVEARPTPTKFAWSFVPLDELARLLTNTASNQVDSPLTPDNDDTGTTTTGATNFWARLNESSNIVHLETKSNELAYADLRLRLDLIGDNNTPRNLESGLVLCRAHNQMGWQERACVNLALPSGEYYLLCACDLTLKCCHWQCLLAVLTS